MRAFPDVVGLKGEDGEPIGSGSGLPVQFSDSVNVDAFQRLRVGLPQLRLSCLFDYGKRPIFWAEKTAGTGAGTHLPNERSVALTVSASGDSVIRQTKEYFTYRAGQSHLTLQTFCMGSDANVTQKVGYFDAEDGFFLMRRGTDAFIVKRSFTTGAAVDTEIAQADWNLDVFDGDGPSGIVLDLDTTHIFGMDLQWLGVGRVRIGFDIDGQFLPAHQFLHANHLTEVYIRTPKLPIRYEIEATGTPSAATTLKQICATVMREGGDEDPSVQHEARSLPQVAGNTTVGANWTTVLGVRCAASTVRATLRLLNSSLWNLDTNMVEFAVVLNPAYTGTPTWAAADDDSVAEVSRFTAAITVDANGDPTPGHVYPVGGYVSGNSNQNKAAPVTSRLGETVPIAADVDGVPDECWLVARAYDASAQVKGLLAWVEER